MAQFWTASNVTINDGQTIVTVNIGDDVDLIDVSSVLQINTLQIVEVKSVNTSNQTIELFEPWDQGNINGGIAIAAPSGGELRDAVADVRRLISIYEGIAENFGDILTSTNSTVNIGDYQVVPYGYIKQQLEGDFSDFIATNQATIDAETASVRAFNTQREFEDDCSLIMDYANGEYKVYEQFDGQVEKFAEQIQTFSRGSEKTAQTPRGLATAGVDHPVIELGKGLSIHEQRTNLFSTNSTSGFAVGRSSRVSSEIVRGVDGFVYRGNSGEANPLIINNQVTNITIGNNYSFSIYVQKRDSDECEIVLATNGAAANGVKILFNFSSESSFVVYNNTEYMSLYDFSYEKLSDGFYRLTLIGTLVTGTSLFCLLYWGDEKDIWAGGAQLEEGTFSSPLIPSNGTQETRQADVCMIDNIDQSDWWNPNEGTFVVEFESKGIATVGNASAAFYAYSSSPSLDAITVRVLTSGSLSAFVSDSSGNTKTLEFGITDSFNKKLRAVLSIGNGVLKVGANGGAVNSVTTGIQQPAPLLLSVGGRKKGGQEINGTIKFIGYMPKAVSDEKLQELSTL